MSTSEASAKAQIGLIGLGVMGRNLVLNIEDHGFAVAVWNRHHDKVEDFIAEHRDRRLIGTKEHRELVAALERPRRILLMVKAGPPFDAVAESLVPLLDEGDILIDGGNTWFEDTRRREAELRAKKLRFCGVGISGGEEGARFGPSLMPGGAPEAYAALQPIFEAIAAKTESGPCVTHVGPDGAGHFVKMVHNGIEYADMQFIAEAYDILRRGAGLGAEQLAEVFAEWNEGPLGSFLIEITAKILTVRDERTDRPLVDLVLDRAGQKGTGKWTVQAALAQGVPVPSIAAALDARVLSSMKDERVAAAERLGAGLFGVPFTGASSRQLVERVRDALLVARICAYAQGLHLIRSASATYEWGVDLAEVARIWKGGCIIRSRLLEPIRAAYGRDADLPNLLVDPGIADTLTAQVGALREVTGMAQRAGIPVPGMAASLAYYDSYRSPDLPQNLVQAQRDAFGAHTYQRRDEQSGEAHHTEWLK